MFEPDEMQRQVLACDPTRHATILGAPGSGKTALLVRLYDALTGREGWRDSDVLVLAADRQVATRLRAMIDARVQRAVGGTPVRTGASFAFSLLAEEAARTATPIPRLVTGPAQAEYIVAALAAAVDSAGSATHGLLSLFTRDVLGSDVFSAELRELARVLDEFSIDPASFRDELHGLAAAAAAERVTRAPEAGLIEIWRAALDLLIDVRHRLSTARPHDATSSGMLRRAVELVGRESRAEVPRVIMIDDAQELSEGELALVSACAFRGSTVWAFGDPDTATSAFQGEHTAVLDRLGAELGRKMREQHGALPAAVSRSLDPAREQTFVLDRVYRHGATIRGLVQSLSARVGGRGVQRDAETASVTSFPLEGGETQPSDEAPRVRFVRASTIPEQVGVIAHRLRQHRLGLAGATPVRWSEMAVICRSRGEVSRVSRHLTELGVPTGISRGGLILRDHPIVRDLVLLLRHALGITRLAPKDLMALLGGALIGLDAIALRRLRGELSLRELRAARASGRDPRSIDAVIAEYVDEGEAVDPVDSRGGRALDRLAKMIAESTRLARSGATARETLWAIWDGAGRAAELQGDALGTDVRRSDDAHRSLDAVLGLFFVLQRHEEHDSDQPVAQVLQELMESSLPQDSLAERSGRESVTVTTPQGVIGQEFQVVSIIGPQDGVWPNLRTRGSLLGVPALERWLRGLESTAPSRRETLHDELRLFVQASSRARDEVLAVAVQDEDQHPSPFFAFGQAHGESAPLSSSRLTLRGAVAEMRRRLTDDPDDVVALNSLATLATAGVPGAHPDEWYGVREPSTRVPLSDLDAHRDDTVSVSPSQMERAETCPLDWVIAKLGGGSASAMSDLGTLIHAAFEHAQTSEADEIYDSVIDRWHALEFDADWESARARRIARSMAAGLAEYLREFDASDRRLVSREQRFELAIDRARVSGVADRLEAVPGRDGSLSISVVDLKTGRTKPSASDLARHAQLQAYQLGVLEGVFAGADGEVSNGGARLLYVHPDAVGRKNLSDDGSGFIEVVQPPLGDEARREFEERVRTAAEVMASDAFTAHVEHHCSNPHATSDSCRIHIVPAVSFS